MRQDPAELDEVVEEGLRLANDPESRAWLLAIKAAAGLRWSGWAPPDPLPIDDRLEAAAVALDAADRLGAPNLAGIVLHVRGYLQHDAGRYVEALPTLQRLAQRVEDIESPYLRALSSMWISLAFADQAGDYAEALAHARRSLDIGRTRTPHERMHGTMGVMWCAYHLGDWATVHDLLDEHLTALSAMSPSCCPYVRAGPMLGALALAQGGDPDRARRSAGQVERDLTEPGLPEALLARVLVATGDPDGGARLASSMVDGGRRPSLEQNDHETHALIEAMLASEDWDGLRDILPSARQRAGALAILGPICDRAEAIALVASGSPDEAVPLLRRAADWFGRSRVPFELARTMTLLAPLVPDGDRLLAEAMVTAEPLLDTVGRAEHQGGGSPALDRRACRRVSVEILALVAEVATTARSRRSWSQPPDRRAPRVEHLPEARPRGPHRPRGGGHLGSRHGVPARAPVPQALRVGRYVSAAAASGSLCVSAPMATACGVPAVQWRQEVLHGPPRARHHRGRPTADIVPRVAQRRHSPRRPNGFAYVTGMHTGTGVEAPDFIAVVDTDPASPPTYGTIVHETPMPAIGDEFHHFGWNRCSSACHGPDRSHLIVPGFRSSRVYILNVADDPRRPRLEKVIEPEALLAATGYSRPHTVHCMPGENIVISMLGDADGKAAGGFAVLDARTFEIKGRWNDGGPTPPFNYDFWYQPRLDTLISSEFGEPNAFEPGFDLADVQGRALRAAAALLEPVGPTGEADDRPGREGLVPLELRWLHDPDATQGFAAAALSSAVWRYQRENGPWVGGAGGRDRPRAARRLAVSRSQPDHRHGGVDG